MGPGLHHRHTLGDAGDAGRPLQILCKPSNQAELIVEEADPPASRVGDDDAGGTHVNPDWAGEYIWR